MLSRKETFLRISLMQFVTDLTPPPQSVAVWAEERGFAALAVFEREVITPAMVVPDSSAGDRARTAIDAALARVAVTNEGNTP